MRAVIVTGGAGYIGRHVVARLAALGFDPYTVDLRSGFDLLDGVGLGPLAREVHPLGIIHLAAHSDVAESMTNPTKYDENVVMSRVVAGLGLPTVLASSAAIYGEPNQEAEPIAEQSALTPINPYGVSKLLSEAVLPDAMRLRLFNVAGGCGDCGGHLIPNLVRAAAEQRCAHINGDVRTVRDYVHVADVARACVSALKALLDGAQGAPLNICTGQGHTIGDVVTLTAAITGEPLRVKAAPHRAGDPARLVGDNSAAKALIGWAPRESISSMIASAWNERVLQSA